MQDTLLPRLSLDTLSRLKGIETGIYCNLKVELKASPLDTLSRLKGIETVLGDAAVTVALQPLDTLSRLKGIETFLFLPDHAVGLLWIRFPV